MFSPHRDRVRQVSAILLTSALVCGTAVAQDKPGDPKSAAPVNPAPASIPAGAEVQTGLAAYYSDRLHGHRTASGQRYNRNEMTTAHQTLPFGTRVRVTNVKNNRSVVLRVNDRGPTQAGRIVDVSRAAAGQLGMLRSGLAEVKVEVVK